MKIILNIIRAGAIAAAVSMTAGCDPESPLLPGDEGGEPSVIITSPAPVQGIASYSRVITFRWEPAGEGRTDFTRFLWSQVVDTSGNYDPGFDFTTDLNQNPWRYEHLWSRWTRVDESSGSGLSVVLGEDGELQQGRYHFFAVQSRSAGGDTTVHFEKNANVRHFLVRAVSGPYLRIFEPLAGAFRFIDTGMNPVQRMLPPGIPLRFRWKADASYYGGDIKGYRYAWDLTGPDSWSSDYEPGLTSAEEAVFNSGTHVLTVEACDLAGNVSRGRVTVEIVPWPMDRPLLWVDDFYSQNIPIPDLSWPPEYEHDGFWTGICSTVPGFDPSRDSFDCSDAGASPGMQLAGRYKNIIWTYSGGGEWDNILLFVPETLMEEVPQRQTNLLGVFLRKGGHIWTLGRSDGSRGLAAVIPPSARVFPCDVRCEIEGTGADCSADRPGMESFAYEDMCVTVIDKASGALRTDADMPYRLLPHFDVMIKAEKDDDDPVTSIYPGLPDSLLLREDVTAPGSFFCTDSTCSPGGFTYAEAYDPPYWMSRRSIFSRSCFHPVYLMRTAAGESALDGAPAAFWITSYEDVVPDVLSGSAVAAPSIHFGFPLWFFRKEQVDSTAAVIFDIWGIGPGTGGAR